MIHTLSGRISKRLAIAIVVHLARTRDDPAEVAELAYTENVSAHGACVVSRRAWSPGEQARVTSFREHIEMSGEVVHCHKCGADRYAVGFTFPGQEVTWSTFRNYAAR